MKGLSPDERLQSAQRKLFVPAIDIAVSKCFATRLQRYAPSVAKHEQIGSDMGGWLSRQPPSTPIGSPRFSPWLKKDACIKATHVTKLKHSENFLQLRPV
jgi:hypothetical protein